MKPNTTLPNPKYRSVKRLVLPGVLGIGLALGFMGPDVGILYAHSDDPGGHKGHSKNIGATVYKHMCTFCHG